MSLASFCHCCDCNLIVTDAGGQCDVGYDGADDVELLAVDSPLRSSNHIRRSRRVGGILRLRQSSDDVHDDDADDALLSLEHELTHSKYYLLAIVVCTRWLKNNVPPDKVQFLDNGQKFLYQNFSIYSRMI